MKKVTKITAAAAIALSAVTPVAAFASESTLATGYYADTFTSLEAFKAMSSSQKKAFLTSNMEKPNFVYVYNGQVFDLTGTTGEKIMNASDDEVAKYAVTPAAYQTATGVTISATGIKSPVGDLKVESVSAINDKSLKVTGEGLAGLKAADVTVATNTVASIVPAADGKSATINLSSSLIPGQDTKVTVKDTESTKEYTVNYKITVSTVEFVSASFDDDLANQKVQVKVNGALVDADYLALSGYSVNFVAVQKTITGVATTSLFAGATNQSTTGILNTGLPVGGVYEVEVQVSKSGTATISAKGTVSIANIHAQAQTIDSVKFVNAGANGADTTINSTFDTTLKGTVQTTGVTDFFMNSKTVVAGEKFAVQHAVVTKSGEKRAAAAAEIKVTSSNPAVLSVTSTGVVTAESAGTATITVEIGGIKQAHTFTVSNEKRKLVKVTSDKATVNVIKGNANKVNVKLSAFDQYGDPFAIVSGTAAAAATGTTAVDEVIPTNAAGTALADTFDLVTAATVSTAGIESNVGEQVVQFDGADADTLAGSGTVYIKNKASETVGAFVLNVTEVNNVTSVKSEIINTQAVGYSADRTLEATEDNNVRFQLGQYNSQGVYAGALDLGATGAVHTVTVVNPDILSASSTGGTYASGVLTTVTGDTFFDLTAVRPGTTDVLVKNKDGVVVAKETITVTNNGYKIASVAWKQVPTIDYATKTVKAEDVLTFVKSSLPDPIIKGITLNKATNHEIRLSAEAITVGTVTHTAGAALYLDVNGNGDYEAGDIALGTVTGTVTSGSVLNGAAALTASSPITNIITGAVATALGDEATIIFKVMTNPADATTSVSSTTVNVKVPK